MHTVQARTRVRIIHTSCANAVCIILSYAYISTTTRVATTSSSRSMDTLCHNMHTIVASSISMDTTTVCILARVHLCTLE